MYKRIHTYQYVHPFKRRQGHTFLLLPLTLSLPITNESTNPSLLCSNIFPTFNNKQMIITLPPDEYSMMRTPSNI